jgi:energy-coupling factor transporter ATP-binding protein EcfA2
MFFYINRGVRDENTKDQNTWIACRNEIERCKNYSDGLFFLSLQGDKYGYKPLPKFMSKKILDKLIFNNTEIDEDIKNIAKLNYILDSNSRPCSCYVLKILEDVNDNEYWNNTHPNLIKTIHHASITNFSDDNEEVSDLDNDLLVDRSVTEYEIKYALQDEDSKQRIKWIHRHFQDEQIKENWICDSTNDEQRKVDIDNLKKYMNNNLDSSNVKEFSNLTVASYLKNDEKCQDYLKNWENYTTEMLFDELSSVVTKKNEWSLDGLGVGMKGEILEEILNHYKLANIKISEFVGRRKILDEALNIIFKNPIVVKNNIDIDIGEIGLDLTRSSISNDRSIISKIGNLSRSISNGGIEEEVDVNITKYEGICLALVGNSGSGKTSLLSKLLEEIYLNENCGDRPVIIRFCGSTNESVSGLKLVTSIVHQIHFLFNCKNVTVPVKYEDLILHFHMLLNKYELILIIDSVELLNDTNQARSHLSFLAGVKCHINTKIILSMLPDDKKSNKYFGCQTCCERIHQLLIENIDIANESAGVSNVKEILTFLLLKQNRTLTEEQWSFVFNQISFNPTILYLKLASMVFSQWRSSTPIDSLILPSTVEGTLNHVLDQIERDFGIVFVRAALCFITFSMEGIKDNEMIDLLSLDDDVLEFVFQYNQSNRLPSHVWFRLRFALSSFFVERGNGCLNWYHRSLHDIAEKRFTHDEILNSRILIAKYFGNLIDENLLSLRLIQPQPISLNSIPVWFADSEVNRRRCVEGFPQMISANLLYEAITEMCNFDLICACCKSGIGFILNEFFSILFNKLEMKDFTQNRINSELILKLNHFMLW